MKLLALRTLLRTPLQFAIMILGIALGVAVMVGIDLANTSAAQAFELSTNAITGRATHAIVAGDQGVDQALYVRLRTDPRWRTRLESAPLVVAYTVSPQLGEVPFTLLGIDPFAEAPFRSYLGEVRDAPMNAFASLLTVPGSILLSGRTAQAYGLQPCVPAALAETCRLNLTLNGKTHPVYLTGLLEPADEFSRRVLDTLILTDIATAQSLAGMGNTLTQIDLILPEEFDTAALTAALPAGTRLVPSEWRNSQVGEMTAAFRINLTALSLLALLVGVFLIYNTMTFSVVQRRALFGILRSIGYTREQIFRMVLLEAALVGLLGAVLGLGLGILLGYGAIQLVTQTLTDLFFIVTVRGVQVDPASLLKGGLAGFLASLLAAAAPAWEAASVPPHVALSRIGLESKTQILVGRAAVVGLCVALAGAGILSIPTRDLVVSFGGTTAVILGLAMLTPLITAGGMRLLTDPLGNWFGLLGRLAPREVIRSQSRTAIAVAALMIAVAVTIGVQIMISSFRTTVTLWLEQTLRGDIYISAQGLSNTRLDTPLDPRVSTLVRADPSVQSSLAIRVVEVESEQGSLDLIAASMERPMDPRLFLSVQGSPEQTWQMLQEGAILLSEPLAIRLGISQAGGSLELLTPQGWQSFPIAGIYADYASTRGTMRMSLEVYRQLWRDEQVNGLALFLKPGADVDEVLAGLRTQFRDFPALQINPNAALRQEALVIFDRTFAITAAMQLITTLVAVIGILSSLLALQLEKAHEVGILRALGLSLADLRRLIFWETGLLGASAGLLALPTGYVLAWILVFVINQRSFGWTLQLQVDAAPFVQAFLLALAAAWLAALYPIWRAGRRQVAEALRGE